MEYADAGFFLSRWVALRESKESPETREESVLTSGGFTLPGREKEGLSDGASRMYRVAAPARFSAQTRYVTPTYLLACFTCTVPRRRRTGKAGPKEVERVQRHTDLSSLWHILGEWSDVEKSATV